VIAAQPLRVAISRPCDIGDGGRRDAGEHRVALGDLEELVDGIVTEIPTAIRLHGHRHQPLRIFVRERVENHGVYHAVHRRGAADTERQRTDSDRCK
jgi:hypothetical protein